MATRPYDSCPHRPACPGCPRFGVGGIGLGAARRLEALAQPSGIALTHHEGANRHHRRRARLSIRGRRNSPKIGIFEAGTHRVTDIPHCRVHDPLINDVCAALKAAIRECRVTTYSDTAHAGVLRGCQVAVQRSTAQAQLTLICNTATAAPVDALAEALADRLSPHLHSLWWNGNTERTNRILGPSWHRFFGPPAIEEWMGGARVFFPPGAFGQNNLDLFSEIVALVAGWSQPGAPVADLYCGTGSLGLGLLHTASSVLFNEVAPDSLRGLRLGLQALPSDVASRASVVEGPAELALDGITTHHEVVVDPPRKGLEPQVLSGLLERRPRQITYVSCGLDSFTSQAAQLLAGGYALRALHAFELFPFTEHVETVARLQRRD